LLSKNRGKIKLIFYGAGISKDAGVPTGWDIFYNIRLYGKVIY
jgi:hypothetical protein